MELELIKFLVKPFRHYQERSNFFITTKFTLLVSVIKMINNYLYL